MIRPLPGLSPPWLHDDEFVGRDRELRILTDTWAAGRRLISLVGIAGIGKTRLALHWAMGLGAVHFVDLSEDAEARLQQLGTVLSTSGPSVVLLDGAEFVQEQLCGWLTEWGSRAETLRFLVTSRRPLRMAAEQAITVSPLDPDAALRLLVARYRDRCPHVDPFPEHDALVDIADQLDGIPLALERAASRLLTLSPGQLSQRLNKGWSVLDIAMLDGSWAQLSPSDQRVLARCTVFPGSFTVEAAEAVLETTTDTSVLDSLQRLIEVGLLYIQAGGSGVRRLRLVKLVRAYAAGRLDPELREGTIRRHASHYLEYCGSSCHPSGLLANLLDRVNDEHEACVPHLDAIVGRTQLPASDRVDAALAIVGLRCREAPVARTAELLALAETLTSPASLARARVVATTALSHRYADTPGPSLEAIDEASRTALAEADHALAAQLAFYRARWLRQDGRMDEAIPDYTRATTLAERSGCEATRALCAQGTAIIANWTQPSKEARAETVVLVRYARQLDFLNLQSAWLINLCTTDWELGNLEASWAAGRQAVRLQEASSSHTLLVDTWCMLGFVAIARDQLDDAHDCLVQAARCRDEVALPKGSASSLAGQVALLAAWIALVEERYEEAEAALPPFGPTQVGIEHGEHAWLVGLLALLKHRPTAALVHLTEAVEALAGFGGVNTDLPVILAFRALVRVLVGDRSAWHDDLEKAEALADQWQTVRHEGTLQLLRQGCQVGVGDTNAEVTALRTLAAFEARRDSTLPPYAMARLAARLLRAQLPGTATLVVGPHLAWARLGGEARIDLRRRPVTQSLLRLLVQTRERNPGVFVSKQALIDAAWSGDRAQPEALSNRLWTALSKVRRAGLDAIERGKAGYRIPERIQVVHVGESS
ncbi:MAG: hypothetical protein AAGA48_36705 [Myxococcota bacterium]